MSDTPPAKRRIARGCRLRRTPGLLWVYVRFGDRAYAEIRARADRSGRGMNAEIGDLVEWGIEAPYLGRPVRPGPRAATISFDEETFGLISARARRKGVSFSAIVRELVEGGLGVAHHAQRGDRGRPPGVCR